MNLMLDLETLSSAGDAAAQGSRNVAKALKPIATQVNEIHSATTE